MSNVQSNIYVGHHSLHLQQNPFLFYFSGKQYFLWILYEQCEHTCELNVWEIAACSNWVIARNWLISCFKHVGHTSVKNVQASHQEPQIHNGRRSHDQAELGMHHTFSFFADSFYSLMFWMSLQQKLQMVKILDNFFNQSLQFYMGCFRKSPYHYISQSKRYKQMSTMFLCSVHLF